jgi:hypothetical protein
MQKTQMKNKDARTRLMNEILNNIRSIKLYSAYDCIVHEQLKAKLYLYRLGKRFRTTFVCYQK